MSPSRTPIFNFRNKPFLLAGIFLIFVFNIINWWFSDHEISSNTLTPDIFFFITTVFIASIFVTVFSTRKQETEDREFLISLVENTYETLTRIHKEPDSIEPYLFFLGKLESLSGAISSAIYVSDENAVQMKLLASTDSSDTPWPTISPYNISIESGNEIHLVDNTSTLYNIVFIPINRGMDIHAQLIFKVPVEMILTDQIEETFELYSRFITNILYITKLADTNLRNVQYLERSTIARELHDSIAQSLSYMKIQASRLQGMVSSSSLADDDALIIDNVLQDLRSTINIAYRHLRELMSSFRITMGGRGFSQALIDSINEFSGRSIIAIDVDNRLPENTLAVPEEIQLLLIIRECLSNIVRHSQATSAQVSILSNNNHEITVGIKDNGIGFPKSYNRERHHGIIIMQERILALRGKIIIKEQSGDGTIIVITFKTSKQQT